MEEFQVMADAPDGTLIRLYKNRVMVGEGKTKNQTVDLEIGELSSGQFLKRVRQLYGGDEPMPNKVRDRLIEMATRYLEGPP